MNPIFIEVNSRYVNIVSISRYRVDDEDRDFTEVFFIGDDTGYIYKISINEFKGKIDEALAKKN